MSNKPNGNGNGRKSTEEILKSIVGTATERMLNMASKAYDEQNTNATTHVQVLPKIGKNNFWRWVTIRIVNIDPETLESVEIPDEVEFTEEDFDKYFSEWTFTMSLGGTLGWTEGSNAANCHLQHDGQETLHVLNEIILQLARELELSEEDVEKAVRHYQNSAKHLLEAQQPQSEANADEATEVVAEA